MTVDRWTSGQGRLGDATQVLGSSGPVAHLLWVACALMEIGRKQPQLQTLRQGGLGARGQGHGGATVSKGLTAGDGPRKTSCLSAL